PARIRVVNNAVETAEDLVSNHYKLSASQWLGRRYDVKTAVDLEPGEIIHEEGHFAQLMRYEGQPRDGSLGSTAYDLYRICLQDHTILAALDQNPDLPLFPFCLYIVIHELVHIVRFSEFLQIFEASREEKMAEEMRVHAITHEILEGVKVSGLSEVLDFYKNWRVPIDEVGSS
ncbi:MAG: hypothetical protein GY859_38910, partial [Desulfobacterales bacterium]|nr:hypothetical protein [Desulfobacterales bacterium]